MEIRNENGLVKLIPAAGMRLYDGETVAEGEVYVGTNDTPENWREVTEAEAEEIRKMAEEKANAEAATEAEEEETES